MAPSSPTDPPRRAPYRRASGVPAEVHAAFGLRPVSVERLGHGHINETFVVRLGDGSARLLQAINHDVFTAPERVMDNLERILPTLEEHREVTTRGGDAVRWAPLSLLRTCDGACSTEDGEGRTWRAFPFIEDTVTRTAPRQARDVAGTAFAFGSFQARLASLGADELHETIPRFHDTEDRYRQLDEAIEADAADRRQATADLIDRAASHRELASRLLELQRQGLAPRRVVHNDAKIGNVLFDRRTGAPVCVVDLDTVMAGISLYDFGDMVRSMCHTSEEDERDLSRVRARPDLFEALVAGFVDGTAGGLTPDERDHLLDAGLVLVLEQGIRFLADHLAGDRYFRVTREGHNLDRARTQFALLQSLLDQEDELRRLARTACAGS